MVDVSFLVANPPNKDEFQLPLAVKVGPPVTKHEAVDFDYEENIWVCIICSLFPKLKFGQAYTRKTKVTYCLNKTSPVGQNN